MILVLIGMVIGAVCAIALTQLMKSLLFGVTTTDPLSFLSLSAVLALVALLACYMPARKASRIDPMSVLRAD
jgi:ABC-type antimicrobial peptide transport system permease subunit